METPETEVSDGLTKDEDDALRRLSFFADNAGISEWTQNRIDDLRSNDRRRGVRPPRDEPLTVAEPDDEDPA